MKIEDHELKLLKAFLSMPHHSGEVLETFADLPGAVRRSGGFGEGFVYIPAARKNAVLLVAHADTVGGYYDGIELVEDNSTIRNRCGILGADDRAGCAMLWMLRNLGHGLLVTDGEEYGGIGANFLIRSFPELFDEINRRYRFMLQIDRRGNADFKCYGVGTEEFRAYVGRKTGFSEPDRQRWTDIAFLCRNICGANLSCGYYNEHTPSEYLMKEEWYATLQLLRAWLAEDELPHFPLPRNT